MPGTRVTPEEYEAARGDPTKIPRLRDAIQAAGESAEEPATSVTDLRTPEVGPLEIGGMALRPMSPGVVAVLERLKHPVMTGSEMTVTDILALLWCLAAPVSDVLDAVDGGTVARRATEWGMGLTMKDMERAQGVAQSWLDECSEEAPGNGAGNKSE